jgi:signal peptidase I
MTKSKQRKHGGVKAAFSWFWEQVKSLGIAIIIVLAIRSSVIEAFKIPSGSMIPTLMVGDYIFVNKFAYGWKAPFWDWFVRTPLYIGVPTMPQRGDVIVFKYPKDESLHYIKRVMGLPGDRISVHGKVVYLNGKPLRRDTVAAPSTVIASIEGREYDRAALELFNEEVFGQHRKHFVLTDSNRPYFSESPEIEVPEGHLFVMGDNRDYSADSRVWGFVPLINVRGKALFVWFSLWLDFGKGEYYFHPERVGTVIR